MSLGLHTPADPLAEPVLVFRTGQLGDMIVSLPAMWAARQHWPQARLTLLSDVHPGSGYVLGSEIFRGAGLFDEFEHYDVPPSHASRWGMLLKKIALLFRLRAGKFRTLIYLAPSIRSPERVARDRRFFRAAGVKRFIGMDHFPPVPFLNAPRPLPAAGHEADLILARLRSDGIPVPEPGQGSLDLGLGVNEEQALRTWLESLPSDQGRIWVGIGPASKMPAKRWPLERFRDVIHGLIAQFGIWPVVFGGPEDGPLAETLLENWGCGYNAAGSLPPRVAAWALKRCALYLGNDSGTMHLAAAAGTSCVAVFSSRDWPGSWSPYGVERRVFRSEIECEGCYLTECVERQNECLNRISAVEVQAACAALLKDRRKAKIGAPLTHPTTCKH